MICIDYLYDKSTHAHILDNRYIITGHLSYKTYFNGFIAPNIVDDEHHYYDGVWSNDKIYDKGTGHNSAINDVYNFERSFPSWWGDVTNSNDKVVFIGSFSGIWGHFITDSIRMLWFLSTKEFKEKYKDYRLVYTAWHNFELKGPFKRALELIGIDTNNLFEVKNITNFKEIIVPDSSFVHDIGEDKACFYRDYIATIEQIIQGVELKSLPMYGKIYYSCSKKKHGSSIGEEKIEKFLKRQGFLIVYPEEHTLDEQIIMMQNCKVFASTDGSSMHNCVFCNPETTLLIIPRGPYSSGYQDALNYVKDFNIYYIDSSLSILTDSYPYCGPFYYYVSDNLLSFFNLAREKKYIEHNFYDIKKYIEKSLYGSRSNSFMCNYKHCELFFHYYSLYIKTTKKYMIYKLIKKIKSLFNRKK